MSNTSAVLFKHPAMNLLSGIFQDRIFYVDPVDSCNFGWYISSPTGRSYGPFLTKEDADRELKKMIM